MPCRPPGRVLAGRVLPLLATLLLLLLAVAATPAMTTAAAAPSAVVADTPSPTPPVTENPFIPPDKNLSDCVSANPLPGCGSKAHGGWRQFLVFVFVFLAMAFIGWRIVVIVRRNRKALESSGRR